ncbi:carboxypeptidase-like regulatory domain-containing protein [Mucilaginibacter sp. RB4R14]|uniref:carboxypeptidase-like regulatory domain-containing protein n=1 Tax=Mucilaginibacter aurantiaciroseus TaxID=2949308 RepID=UPI002090A664|nr:carboxypeptidase-like regulatory domain-containing protein [Mucilaginibacter aurantiaciroseus]MCO5935331.1 carboxypeptidase-like regulatory domain-containing protein [Mucilaginibacter aurantiaciroseus]
MRSWCFLFVCITLSFTAAAQSVISGKVLTGSNNPVAKASVFLNNATFGTATNDDGTFTLRGVKPGQYDLIVSAIGFEEYTQKVMVGSATTNLAITLTTKVLMMREVIITSNADWKKNFELFKKDFIGVTENAKYCKIENPRILSLAYSRKKMELEASTDEFLVMKNEALGYRVKFLLKEFLSSSLNNTISYAGRALFEELPGTEVQKAKWKLKRDEAYYGSARHFYRSLYKNKLKQEGFEIYDFNRTIDPNRAPDLLIQRKLKQFQMFNRDSTRHWLAQQDMPRWHKEKLTKPALTAYQIIRKPLQEGLFVMTFPNYLYVVYTKKHETQDFKDLYRPLDMENFETSVITLLSPAVYFDLNGTVVADSPLYEGTWSKAKLANLLPVDYEPLEQMVN